MTLRDSKRRYIKNISGTKIPFNLKRYCCPVCHKLHTELPDLVEPNKHYQQMVIDAIRGGYVEAVGIDDSTMRYWRKN